MIYYQVSIPKLIKTFKSADLKTIKSADLKTIKSADFIKLRSRYKIVIRRISWIVITNSIPHKTISIWVVKEILFNQILIIRSNICQYKNRNKMIY